MKLSHLQVLINVSGITQFRFVGIQVLDLRVDLFLQNRKIQGSYFLAIHMHKENIFTKREREIERHLSYMWLWPTMARNSIVGVPKIETSTRITRGLHVVVFTSGKSSSRDKSWLMTTERGRCYTWVSVCV